MMELQRYSPVTFKDAPKKTETRNLFEVVLEYDPEGDGPWLVDLSHRTRLDFQDAEVGTKSPLGLSVPGAPGACQYDKGMLCNRMNRTQTALWHLAGDEPEIPAESSFTDVTEATVFLALMGKGVFSILEKLTALDLLKPETDYPRLFQGPVSHVPCQVVVLEPGPENGCVILTCSRGYARDMVHAMLAAGAEFGLSPAGESRFTEWIKKEY